MATRFCRIGRPQEPVRWATESSTPVVVNRSLGAVNKPVTSYTNKIDEGQATELRVYLRDHGYVFREVPHALFAADRDQVHVVCYKSGKVVVQGKGTREFVEFLLEPVILKRAELGYEDVLDPDRNLPRIGVDESGKGDFFGPLCIAGVYVNEPVVKALEDAGVKDSKQISSDRRIAALAEAIQKTPGCVSTVVPIGNEAYNRLYKTMRSVNAILAWGHARVIENLLLQKHRMTPAPVRVISDQFARSKETVSNALMSLGREIELVQRHKAEQDLSVAAASILARHEFVQRLARLGKSHGATFPKGASAAVDKVAAEFVGEHGPELLGKVAKTHFRTAYRARGLPEPPKTTWKKS